MGELKFFDGCADDAADASLPGYACSCLRSGSLLDFLSSVLAVATSAADGLSRCALSACGMQALLLGDRLGPE